jgi:hypothetical protein
MNTFEQIDETKIRVRIADVKPDSYDVKLCVDIIDMGAYKCKRFDAAMIKPDEAITDVAVVNAGLEPIPKIDRHIACDFSIHKCGLQ